MKKKIFHIIPIVVLFLLPLNLFGNTELTALLDNLPDSAFVHVVVIMKERPDVDKIEEIVRYLPKGERKERVWEELQNLVDSSQESIRKYLGKQENLSKLRSLKTLTISNGLVLEAKKELVYELLNRRDIKTILGGSEVEPGEDDIRENHSEPARLDEIPWGLDRIRTPQVWRTGNTGEGVLIAIIDTGVNYLHTDLADHLWDGGDEFPHHGYDFYNYDDNPLDLEGHGTSVAGIIAGDGSSGDTTGIAFDATIMCLKVRHDLYTGRVDAAWQAQDFALEHGADIIAMSLGWGNPGEGDREVWRDNYEILNLAGIVCTKSAGNRRHTHEIPICVSVPGRVPSPWHNPDDPGLGGRGGLITVGAITQADSIEPYSSPGPVTWQDIEPWLDYPLDTINTGLIKPDICAPGENGHSLDYSDTTGYSTFSHTSMAQPHVAGVVALMLSKNPELLPVHVDSILQTTAYDLGEPGKDNDFGAGVVQADAAVNAVPDLSVLDPDRGGRSRIPEKIAVVGIHPNPFNNHTTFELDLKNSAYVRVQVYNLIGQEVAKILEGVSSVGKYSYPIDGSKWSNGLYILRVQVDEKHESQKLLLLK